MCIADQPCHPQDMNKAMKATVKLQNMLQLAWGLPPEVACAALLPSRAMAVAQTGDAATAGSSRSLCRAQDHHAASLKAAHPAAASLHVPGRPGDVAPVLRPQPVWRPLPEATVAALMAAAPGNCAEFVAVAEAELLEQPRESISGSKIGTSAQGDAEAGTSAQASPTRGSAPQQHAQASGSGGRSTFMHVEGSANRYCAYEVHCSPDLCSCCQCWS